VSERLVAGPSKTTTPPCCDAPPATNSHPRGQRARWAVPSLARPSRPGAWDTLGALPSGGGAPGNLNKKLLLIIKFYNIKKKNILASRVSSVCRKTESKRFRADFSMTSHLAAPSRLRATSSSWPAANSVLSCWRNGFCVFFFWLHRSPRFSPGR